MTAHFETPVHRRSSGPSVEGKSLSEIVAKWERLQGAKAVKRAGGLGLVAISLSACKSSSSNDDDTPDPVETVPVVSLFLDIETGRYAFESDVDNIVNVDNSQPRLLIDEGAVGAADSYGVVLTASGAGTLVFSYEEAIDTVTLLDGSVLTGFDTLEVQSGTLDITQADVPDELSVIKVNSGIVLAVDQFADLDEISSESGNGEVTIQVDSQDDADQLRQLLDDGAVSLIGIKPAVASSDPDVDTAALEQQIEESVQEPGGEEPQEPENVAPVTGDASVSLPGALSFRIDVEDLATDADGDALVLVSAGPGATLIDGTTLEIAPLTESTTIAYTVSDGTTTSTGTLSVTLLGDNETFDVSGC